MMDMPSGLMIFVRRKPVGSLSDADVNDDA